MNGQDGIDLIGEIIKQCIIGHLAIFAFIVLVIGPPTLIIEWFKKRRKR